MRVFLFVVLLVLYIAPAWAKLHQLSPEEQAWLKENGQSLVLSFDRNFPPVEFLDENGSFSGLSADLIEQIEKRLAVTFVKEAREWVDVLQALKAGTTAIAPAIVATESRAEYIFFTTPYIRIPQVIVTSRDIKGTLTLDDLEGLRVGVVRGYASAEQVRIAGRGRFEVVEVDSILEGLRDVSFGVTDAFIESLAVAAWYIDREALPNLRVAGDIGVTQDLSIGVSRHYPLLASAVSKSLDSLPERGKKAIINRWIHLPATFFDAQTLGALKLAAIFTGVILLVATSLALLFWRRLQDKIRTLNQTEQELRQQIERFRLALEATKAGFWEYFPQEGREEHSSEWYTMLGYKPQFGSRALSDWSDMVHPLERDKVVDTFTAYLQSDGAGFYESEFRMRSESGQWRWVLGKGRAVAWDHEGRPSRVIGLNLNIHEMKTAQDEAQRAQHFIRALLEQSTQFIGLLDPKGVLRMANQTSVRWANASESSVIGKAFWSGPWWPDKNAAKALLLDCIKQALEGNVVRQEVTHLSPQGSLVPFDFTASPFRDETGEIVAIIIEGRDISAQKENERILAESEQRFRTIFDNAPYAIVINRLSDYQYVDANKTFLDSQGLTSNDLANLTPAQVGRIPDEQKHFILSALQSGHTVHNLETTMEQANGESNYILYSGAVVTLDGEPCILSMLTNITELKKAQESLRRSQTMFSRLFQLSPDMIALARQEDGTLLEVNEAFTRFTGYSKAEAVGRSTLELGIFVNPARRALFAGILLQEKRVENFEFDIRHRDGHILHCSASARLIDMDGRPCILSVTRDITQLRTMQETMVQSEKMLSLGGIAAGIAHEINNPLGIVLQAAQTIALRTKPDFPKNIESAARIGVDLEHVLLYMKERKIDVFIQDIESAASRAAGIIRHMLDFSRRSESRRTVCDLRAIIANAVDLASKDYDLKKNYDFKSTQIVQHIPDDLPGFECTETEIEQVLLNLLRNAAQAMAEAATPEPCITITVTRSANNLRIEIADNGPGVSPEHLKRIFEPFFTTKKAGSGTGLGLSVSYFIITKGHGGRFHAHCPPQGGTVFTIELPLCCPIEDAKP